MATGDEKKTHRTEVFNIVILSLAALAITWCSYQSTLWSGIQTFRLARVNATFRAAQERTTQISLDQLLNASIVINFGNAVAARDTARIRFYIERSRPEMSSLLSGWLAQDPLHNKNAAMHPGATEQYRKLSAKDFDAVDTLRAKGYGYWDDAEHANTNADNYILLTVVFSVVMFFCGLASKMANQRIATVVNFASATIFVLLLSVLVFKMPLAGKYKLAPNVTPVHRSD